MLRLSKELEDELVQRAASEGLPTVDALLMKAFCALDIQELHQYAFDEKFEQELLLGLEGNEEELNDEAWDSIEREAMRLYEAKKSA
jgi:hypothetical protein